MDMPFEIKTVAAGRFNAVTFALDATRPEDYYDQLEAMLARLNVEGEVLLDLLACNGHTSRRFFSMRFDGKRLAFNTMRVEKEGSLDRTLLSMCAAFYSNNKQKLRHTVLSTPALLKLGTAAH